MSGRLSRKLALVTAAGQGIGAAIATAFVDEGANVVATDLDDKKLRGLRKAIRRPLNSGRQSARSRDLQGAWAARHPGELRWICSSRHRARLLGERLGPLL